MGVFGNTLEQVVFSIGLAILLAAYALGITGILVEAAWFGWRKFGTDPWRGAARLKRRYRAKIAPWWPDAFADQQELVKDLHVIRRLWVARVFSAFLSALSSMVVFNTVSALTADDAIRLGAAVVAASITGIFVFVAVSEVEIKSSQKRSLLNASLQLSAVVEQKRQPVTAAEHRILVTRTKEFVRIAEKIGIPVGNFQLQQLSSSVCDENRNQVDQAELLRHSGLLVKDLYNGAFENALYTKRPRLEPKWWLDWGGKAVAGIGFYVIGSLLVYVFTRGLAGS